MAVQPGGQSLTYVVRSLGVLPIYSSSGTFSDNSLVDDPNLADLDEIGRFQFLYTKMTEEMSSLKWR